MSKTILTPKAELIFICNHFKGNQDDCWPWLGNYFVEKYGSIQYGEDRKRYQYLAHRISYLYYNKLEELDSSILICHSCDNPPCVNPHHLFPGSHLDNNRDVMHKGLNQHGEGHYKAILTEDDIREIRYKAARGYSRRKLAKEYGLSHHQSINDIVNRKTWKHVE